jgi:hypothetical protein
MAISHGSITLKKKCVIPFGETRRDSRVGTLDISR